MVDDNISLDNPTNTLKIIDEKLKETAELAKKSQENLKNYAFDSLSSPQNTTSKISSIIKEQERINRNILQNIDGISQKIRIIQESIIGDPTNLSQVGTILDRLNQLERNVLPDPTSWPRLPILAMNQINTQEENISHNLLAMLHEMVEYAKVNAGAKQIKFPLNSNIGDSHLRFERRYHNIKFLCTNSIGIVNYDFLQSVLLIANHLYFGLILTDCLEVGMDRNIKIIKHRKQFDEIEKIYSSTIDVIFDKCPFEVRSGTKESFLALPFPGYYKDDEDE